MQQQYRWTLAFVVVALSVVVGVRAKDADDLGPYRLIKTVLIPGFGNGFDISWVDSEASRYYLADRGTQPRRLRSRRASTSSTHAA